jgi:hypothetical protein
MGADVFEEADHAFTIAVSAIMPAKNQNNNLERFHGLNTPPGSLA